MSSDPTPISKETAVIEYLRNHPDFFERHPLLVPELNLLHPSGQAVSLIERQVALLRERNMNMRARMHELMSAARDNDVLFAKIRSLTLALLDVSNWHELNEIFATYFLVDFEADFVCAHLAVATIPSLAADAAAAKLIHIRQAEGALPAKHLQPTSVPNCAAVRGEELDALFPDQNSDDTETGSVILIPLNIGPRACLAVGSRDPNHFTTDLDTLFASYISDVTSHVVARLMR